jgi:predicted Zn-dependent protease
VNALRASGRPVDEVVQALNWAIANAPGEELPVLRRELAEAYLEAERPGEAIGALEDIAHQDPDQQSALWWQLYGDAQSQGKQAQDAVRSYQRGLELDPANRPLLQRYAELLYTLEELLRPSLPGAGS